MYCISCNIQCRKPTRCRADTFVDPHHFRSIVVVVPVGMNPTAWWLSVESESSKSKVGRKNDQQTQKQSNNDDANAR